jgi:pseudaminic acid synthase
MTKTLQINQRKIGAGHPVYIIAEISANHNQDFEQALQIVHAAKQAGADAIKLQTYTPDTITVDSDLEPFRVKGTIWDGRNLYDLYGEAYTPWDWQPKLQAAAYELGMDLFSSAFDKTAVDFLEEMNVPVHKIASFEIVDIPLIRYMAKTGKPIIISTGMATLAEIDEAVQAVYETGNTQLALLKCNSGYPAPPEEMNLRTIPHLEAAFDTVVGLSDHTLGIEVAVASVALGACLIEKHITLSRDVRGPDSAFSLEPHEFKAMVDAVRVTEKALGRVHYGASEKEKASRAFRRSLFVVKDMEAGEVFTEENVRSIRPAIGLHTRYLPEVLGRKAKHALDKGTPLSWEVIA